MSSGAPEGWISHSNSQGTCYRWKQPRPVAIHWQINITLIYIESSDIHLITAVVIYIDVRKFNGPSTGEQPVNREKPFVYDCLSGFMIRERLFWGSGNDPLKVSLNYY